MKMTIRTKRNPYGFNAAELAAWRAALAALHGFSV